MRIFYRRPLALICAVFITASLIGFLVGARTKYSITLALVIAALICAALFVRGALGGRAASSFIAVIVAALLALLSSYLYFDIKYTSAQDYCGEKHTIEGVVLERRYSNSYSTGFSVKINSIDGKRVNYKVILDCEFVSDLQPGYRFFATGTPEELGYSDYDKTDKILAISDGFVFRCVISSDTDCKITDENAFNLTVWLSSLNRRISSKISSAVGGEAGELTAALALGQRNSLDNTTERDFRRTGVSHLLALSGMHLTILMGAAELLLRRLRTPRIPRCILLISLTLSYLALTGFALSAVRAALMLLFVYLSFFFSSQTDSITSLLASCALIIAVSPTAVADYGFWLSFTATLGIIVGISASRRLIRFMRRKRGEGFLEAYVRRPAARLAEYVITALLTTTAANCGVAFCSWLFFGEISVVTLITNLYLGPLSTVLLLCALLFVVFSTLHITAGIGLCTWIMHHVAENMLVFAAYFSDLKLAVVSLRYDFAGVIIILMSTVLAIMCIVKLKHKWTMALPVLAAIVTFTVCLTFYNAADSERITVSYVRNKSSDMLVVSSVGEAVICDISDGSKTNIKLALTAAQRQHVREVAAFILTHYHQKHIVMTDYLLGNEIVRQIWLPAPENEREYGIMLSIRAVAERYGCVTVIYDKGGTLTLFGDAELTVDSAYIKRSTHPTITLSLSVSENTLTYAGASVHDGTLLIAATDSISASTDIIFGSHGPVTKTEYLYALPYDRLNSIIFATDTVLAAFRYDTAEESRLSEITLVRSPQIYVFTYKKNE